MREGQLRGINGRPLRYKKGDLRLLFGSEFNNKEPLFRRVLKFFKVRDRTPKGASSARVRRPRAPDQRIDLLRVCVCVFYGARSSITGSDPVVITYCVAHTFWFNTTYLISLNPSLCSCLVVSSR